MASTLDSGGVRAGWRPEGPTGSQGAYTGTERALEAGPAPSSGLPKGTAVIGHAPDLDGHRGAAAAAAAYVQPPPFDQLPLAIDKRHRIIGWNVLRQLLRPTHPYFADKGATITEYAVYKHEPQSQNWLCYPRVKSQHPNNPYRRRQLASSHTARTINKLRTLIDSFELEDFKISSIVLTMPAEISKWLSKQPNGREMAWRIFQRFWKLDFNRIGISRIGQAAFVNLHTWKTENPTKPHFHFHCLIPNYRVVQYRSPATGKVSTACFVHTMWAKQPYSEAELLDLKSLWRDRLIAFARRHKIRCPSLRTHHKIDVYVDYVSWDDPLGRPKLMNKINYQTRHWSQDYAVYSNTYPKAANPPENLESYQNRARTFGWWKAISSFTRGATLKDKERLSPLTGSVMEYLGSVTFNGLIVNSQETLGFLDMVKGRPILEVLTVNEVAWLRSVSAGQTIALEALSLDLPP